jgi:hypothetical protein
MLEFIVGTAIHLSYRYDKEVGSCIRTLSADGTTEAWRGPRFDAPVLYLEGNDERIADWLTHVRNEQIELRRATGWYLIHRFFSIDHRPGAVNAVIYWIDETENAAEIDAYNDGKEDQLPYDFIGPLKDLGLVFLDWRKKVAQQKKIAMEHETLMRLEARAHAEITAIEDDRVFADISHYMNEGHA